MNNKNQKNYKWIIVGVIALAVIFYTKHWFQKKFIYHRPALTIKVIDKETKKPIGYALVKYWWQPYAESRSSFGVSFKAIGYEVVVANKEGKHYFPQKELVAGIGDGTGGQAGNSIGIPFILPVIPQGISKNIEVWFPGYKKEEFGISGEEEKLTIELERPKTAEEAVASIRGSDSASSTVGFLPDEKTKILYYKVVLNKSLEIIKMYPKTEWADKSYTGRFGDLDENKLKKDIKEYYISLSCNLLLKYKDICYEEKERWLRN